MPTLITAQISRTRLTPGIPHDSTHPWHVLGMLVRGQGYCLNGNVRSPQETPWMTLVPEGRRDGNYLQGPYESRYVCFRWLDLKVMPDRRCRFVVELHGVRSPVTPFVVLDGDSAPFCAGLIEDIRDDLQSREIGRLMKAEEGFLRLLRTYLRLASEEPAGTDHRDLAHFRDLLTRRALEPVSLEALCAQCRLTPDHLGRLFRRAYGTTPVAYRTALRMDRARDLLDSSDLNVGEVARRVGYDDPLYFSRAFRLHFGFPPSQRIRALPWPPRFTGGTSSRRARASR